MGTQSLSVVLLVGSRYVMRVQNAECRMQRGGEEGKEECRACLSYKVAAGSARAVCLGCCTVYRIEYSGWLGRPTRGASCHAARETGAASTKEGGSLSTTPRGWVAPDLHSVLCSRAGNKSGWGCEDILNLRHQFF